jgi:hypothetical protein
MSDEPVFPPDLEMDLAKSFQPSWARESDSPDRISRMVAKHGDDDRPERAGKSRDRSQGRNRPPARSNDRRRPDDRKGERRHDRHETRRPDRPAPELQGWALQFRPHPLGVEGLAKQIKTGAKAYPLFDLARLVLEKSERYLVEFQRSSENAPALFQLRADGSIWLSESEAIAHVLAKHLDKFYRRERVPIDPPKGSFSSIGVCGLSGELLGPSNYHDYQDKLRRIHAARFSHMSFEAYKSRVRLEKNEALLARWKEEQSSQEVFYPREPLGEAVPGAKIPELTNSERATPEEVTSETPSLEAAAPERATPDGESPAPEAATAGEAIPEDPAPPEAPEPLKLATRAEVERHFRAHHAAAAITPVRDRVRVPGPSAMNESSPPIHTLARRIWEELQRFPLPLAHLIGQHLNGKGLQIFKSHDNITYISVARPRHLDRVATPVSEALSTMLEYLEGHSSTPRADQWKALVALRPPTADGDETRRESIVAADLAWLLHEGHVIDFAGRGLETARRPQPRQPEQ